MRRSTCCHTACVSLTETALAISFSPGWPAISSTDARGNSACAASRLSRPAERLLDEAAEHARTREQFGRPIGDFQAVAHPLADAWISLTSARALVRAAAEPVDRARGHAGAEVGAARLSAERAALRASRVAHQTLGALGITVEGPLFHISRRVRQLALAPPGTAGHAREAVLRSLTLTGGTHA